MADLIIKEPVLDGQQTGPVSIEVEGLNSTATILDSLLNGQGSEIHVAVDEGLQVVGLESLVELQAQLGAIEGRVNEALQSIDNAVELANDTVDQLNQAAADLLALVVRAETASDNAKSSELAAAASQVAARASELAAAASQAAAAASATNSANSATAANNSKNAAASSASAALASQNAAKTSETNSKTSETNAASSASAANTSKNAAATSATNASNSASDALASKNAAATSASQASASQIAASNSATAAAASQSAAANSASEANTSKNAAATSATNAANSATAANNSKNAAATSEANSAANASAATAAKNLAQKYATAPEDEVVELGRYSAFHWAEKAKHFAQQTFVSAGTYNPTTANPYPSVTGVTRDTMWLIKITDPSGRFTYTTGVLAGTTVTNGDFLFYDTPANTWEHIPVGIAGVLEVNGKSGQSVTLTAQDVGALPITGGNISGLVSAHRFTARVGSEIGIVIGGNASAAWITPVKSDGSNDFANQLAFNPTTGYWTAQGHKIYTAGQKPTFTDLSDSGLWLAPNAGRIRVGGNTDLVAGREDKGFLPRKEGVGAAAVSYLGTTDWWFGEAWVNSYRGGSVNVTGEVRSTKSSVRDWSFSQHSNGNLELRHGVDNTISLYIVDESKAFYAQGALFENGSSRVYSTGNKPTAADVGAVSITGGDIAGSLLIADHSSAYTARMMFTNSSGTAYIQAGSSSNNAGRIVFSKAFTSNESLESVSFLVSDNNLRVNGHKVYHQGFKPTLTELGAAAKAGDTFTGEVIFGTADPIYISPYKESYSFSNQGSTKADVFTTYTSTGTSEFRPFIKQRGTHTPSNTTYVSALGQLLGSSGVTSTVLHMIKSDGTGGKTWEFSKDGHFVLSASGEVRTDAVRLRTTTGGLVNNSGSNIARPGGAGQATILGNTVETTYIDSLGTITVRKAGSATEGRIYTSLDKPNASEILGGTFSGSFIFGTGGGVGTRFGSTTHKAIVASSPASGEYIFGGSSTGTTTPDDYIRVGRNKLQYETGGSVRDIFHSGDGHIYQTTVIGAPTGATTGKLYPVVFSGLSAMLLTQEIMISTRSSGGSDPMNNCSFKGNVKVGGWSDSGSYVDGVFRIYPSTERAIHSVWANSENTSSYAFYVDGAAFPVTVTHISGITIQTGTTSVAVSESVYNAGVTTPAGTKITQLADFSKGSGRYYNGGLVYHEGFKPSATDVGAVPGSTKAAFIPAGTTANRPASGEFPANTRALRFNTETNQAELVDAAGTVLPLGGSGSGSGVPPFIVRTASFTVVKNQAYSLSMADGVNKTVTVPSGFTNSDWFVVDLTKWDRGLAGLTATINFGTERITNGVEDFSELSIDRPCVAYFQKINGKWQWVDGVGTDGSYNALESRVEELEAEDVIFSGSLFNNNTASVADYSRYRYLLVTAASSFSGLEHVFNTTIPVASITPTKRFGLWTSYVSSVDSVSIYVDFPSETQIKAVAFQGSGWTAVAIKEVRGIR
ncbi:tail fiber protein [Vibrio phage phi 3]|uniref:Tail fiber protein n=1 Tax=Vibrio phage phi 3 TaxID=1589298 RepID=A0A0B5GYV3_9CAUD|nr:tail fiber protein [Vibrio phage phi 3]AJF40891.1 hypothetical protein SBVP3_00124 [Vibrio phage phi 3]